VPGGNARHACGGYLFSTIPRSGGPGFSGILECGRGIETTLPAEQLLSRLLEIERELGRTENWGPRIIDLDLIFYGQQVTRTEGLTIPHPRMHERRFVLQPLVELAPDLVHPVMAASVREFLAALDKRPDASASEKAV